ncbi:Deoxycytidine kinase [Dichanthelium oligosanthes]|uniref:Deoxycytidine kinase n=1 Tax=Dichanthelium oligosanthes TaxID=888268 RepID=A0A1E5WK54_9POAL|nr:Deoxycytidine kinase [Dichanthelium oligosanthes]
MHKLLPRAASSLDAAAVAPLLLSSPRVPTPRLAGSPFLATCPGANPSRIGSPPWLRCDGAGRRGLCSAEAARRGGDTEEEREKGGGGRAVPERRQRGRSDALVGSGELLAIPGVGPRNLRKLVDKGFDGVAQLKQLYRDKYFQFFGRSSEKMVEFLQNSVGIIHKNHAESITLFIKESVDEELKGTDTSKLPKNRRLTFCVEGNISVGKTTFLQRIANETIELRDLVEIVPEPIAKWQDVGPEHFNILDAFYAEPQRYAYTFQNYVFVTRVMQEKESASGIKPLRLMERSVFSDRMVGLSLLKNFLDYVSKALMQFEFHFILFYLSIACPILGMDFVDIFQVFVRAVHEANWMNEMEISIYDSWFDPVVSSLPGLIPDGFIYLRASPDTCHKRMMVRKRSEEGGVTLDYLRGLHEKHESWLLPSKGRGSGVLSVSQLPVHLEGSLPTDIRDRVFYLEGDHMHSSIQKVPALVLDCEHDIDFNKDIEAKKQYARQVAEFFEFVKKKKESTTAETTDGDKSVNKQIMLPHSGGLWVPGNSPLPESALKSFDFRRTMSSFLST